MPHRLTCVNFPPFQDLVTGNLNLARTLEPNFMKILYPDNKNNKKITMSIRLGGRPDHGRLVQQLLPGLTVSFVAISLGAAFGVLSGRGALAGILSAGVIALITAAFGGTRIQCSGPTAPMTAVTILLVTAVGGGLLVDHPGADPDRFINLVLLLTGLTLVIAGLFRLGRLIRLVPRCVISGFMNGIAVLIWIGEIRSLFGFAGKRAYDGGISLNVSVALVTLTLVFVLPAFLRRIDHRLNSFLPATLAAIVVVTCLATILQLDIQRITLGASIESFVDLKTLVAAQLPTEFSPGLIMLALPFAIQLALLAYLDTLLTSLVVDRKVQIMDRNAEITRPNQELAAQGMANAAVSLFGGIPGAQATIRSVLILNEGATTRLAGVMVGIFVLVEMLIFQDLISLIPQAVFSGVLLKVGYDVFDWGPVRDYWIRSWQNPKEGPQKPTELQVSHSAMSLIAGTTLMTVFVNLSVAVIVFSALYYVLHWRLNTVDLFESRDEFQE